LNHPRTCPHGAPIPPGQCCGLSKPIVAAVSGIEQVQ
jgi:hypothetical protein